MIALAKKEFATAFKDKVFLVMVFLFLLMSVASVYIGATTKNAELRAYDDIVAIAQAQGGVIPAAPQIYPLAVLRNIIQYIIMLGAVLAIFLGFDAFGSEKESGTLRLILTRPLTKGAFLTGKLCGAGMIMGSLLTVTFVFNGALFALTTGLFPSAQEILRLLLFVVLAFFYMMAFYTGSLFVSIKAHDRSYGFLIMMIVWIFISFVVPQMADTQRSFAYAISNVSGVITQTPSGTALSSAIEWFSPAVQFLHFGDDLLQVVSETATISVLEVLAKNAPRLVYLLGIGFFLFLLSFAAVEKEEAL